MSLDVWSGSPKTAWAGLLIAVEYHVDNSIELHRQSRKRQAAKLQNWQSTSAVKTAKLLLREACEAETNPLYLAILNFRNSPAQGNGSSPAQQLGETNCSQGITCNEPENKDPTSSKEPPSANASLQASTSKPYCTMQNPLNKNVMVWMKPLCLGENN